MTEPTRRNVLVIDDDPILRALVAEHLRQEPYDLHEAADGSAGLAILGRVAIDLAVVDMLMPETDGVQVILKIRESWPATRIIAITGGAAGIAPDYLLRLAKTLGADKVMLKPLSGEELRGSVRALTAG